MKLTSIWWWIEGKEENLTAAAYIVIKQVVAVGTVEDDEISNECDGVNQIWLFPELARSM